MTSTVVYNEAEQIALVCTDPATPVEGDPVLVGQIPGVALTNKIADSADPQFGKTTVKMNGAARLSVKGIDGGGNAAVAVGDIIYYVAADTPKLSKKATGVRYGYAFETVGSGATATIEVKIGY